MKFCSFHYLLFSPILLKNIVGEFCYTRETFSGKKPISENVEYGTYKIYIIQYMAHILLQKWEKNNLNVLMLKKSNIKK